MARTFEDENYQLNSSLLGARIKKILNGAPFGWEDFGWGPCFVPYCTVDTSSFLKN
jgi:hypothetical protein